jgi:Ala-tRNA(Pro) deacylase
MPVQKVREFLDQEKVKYVTIQHSEVYTAQEVAASAHISGKEIAKTVIVKVDGKLAMAVVPASYNVDFDLLKKAAGAKTVGLASEGDFKDKFGDCDIGAMPPFGNLYDLDVYVGESLAEDAIIAFNACSHTELIQLAFADFQRLVKPTIAKISTRPVGG